MAGGKRGPRSAEEWVAAFVLLLLILFVATGFFSLALGPFVPLPGAAG